MQKWTDKLKGAKKNKFEEICQNIQNAFDSLPDIEKVEKLEHVAIAWGLPLKMATSMAHKQLISVIAAANAIGK